MRLVISRWAVSGERWAAAALEAKLTLIAPKRMILKDMGDNMLGRAARLPHETTGDGKRVVL